MTLVICEKRQQILDANGHVLVVGGPGSGKTTIALRKAELAIKSGLEPGQKVLFLSFSRAAVARIIEATHSQLSREQQRLLSIQTFHSFWWEILQSHGYLVGCPKGPLQLLMPHDERALSGGLKPPNKGAAPPKEWSAWLVERERLFSQEGKISFDQFAPKVVELLSRSPLVRELISSRYPMIFVDEAQDTSSSAWQCIKHLSTSSQIVCLGDLEQQIFDHLEGVGPERIQEIDEFLKPTRIDLGSDNNRSPGTDIAEFGSDVLTGRIKAGPYSGVSRQIYSPKGDLSSILRQALARCYRSVKKERGVWPDSIAILAPNGGSVARITAALNRGARPVAHKVLFDEAPVLLSARIAAFLLEPKESTTEAEDVAMCLDMFAAVFRAKGRKTALDDATKIAKWAASVRAGKSTRNAALPAAVTSLIASTRSITFLGDPASDWKQIKRALSISSASEIREVGKHLDYLIAFNRGRRISANLTQTWIEHGGYRNARAAVDAALMEDQLLAGQEHLSGIHVMTIHKSKGKQFDAVIVLREGQPTTNGQWSSSLVWRDDPHPYHRSRRILRVAITRARTTLWLLEPAFPRCPILTPFRL